MGRQVGSWAWEGGLGLRGEVFWENVCDSVMGFGREERRGEAVVGESEKWVAGCHLGTRLEEDDDKHNLPATQVGLATRTTCIGYSIESSLFLKLQLINVVLSWKLSPSALSSCTRRCSQLGYNVFPLFWSRTPEKK